MKKAKRIVDTVILTFASIAIISMTLLSIWQVIARYILNNPSTMSEEIIRYTLIWFTLLAAAYVFGKNKHIAILFVRERMSWNAQVALTYLAQIAILLTAAIVFIYGGDSHYNAHGTADCTSHRHFHGLRVCGAAGFRSDHPVLYDIQHHDH